MIPNGPLKSKATVILAVLIPLLATAVLLNSREKTKFDGDESGWISSGYYYSDLLLKGDFEWEKWNTQKLGPWGPMNPHLGKWIIGVPLGLHFPHPHFLGLYDIHDTYQANQRAGNVPPPEMLAFSRAEMAILGGLCCLLIFLIGCQAYNLWVGIAVFLLLGNHLFFTFSTLAMTDIAYNFFLIGLGWCGLGLLRAISPQKMILGSLGAGAISGLACSVKLTGIAIGALFFVAVLCYKKALSREKWRIFPQFLIFSLSSLAVVYALNPLFWPDFKAKSGIRSTAESGSFAKEKPTDLGRATSAEGFGLEPPFPQLGSLSRVFLFPQQILRWSSFLESQKDLPHAGWDGSRVKNIHLALFKRQSTFFGEGLFLLLGIILCSRKIYFSIRTGALSLSSIPLMLFLGNYLFVLVFMTINWNRYYLPTVIASKLVIAIGIFEVGNFLERYGKSYFSLGKKTS